MKYLYIGILILALLAAGCLWSAWEITRRTQAVAQPLTLALSSLRVGDEAEARRSAERAARAWEANEGVLAALVSHEHIDAVGRTFAALPWLRGEELAQALADTLQAIRALAALETVTLRNIF